MKGRWAWLAGGVALGVYALTLHGGLPGGDAGELASAACAGGVAHPPGYPLHGLLLRFFALLPVGSMLTRFHLVSAVCSAVTVGLLVDVVTRWTKRPEAGVLAGVAWLVSPLPWLYATTVEVFALHTALVAAFGWALTRDVELKGTSRSALGLGLFAGLALSNHQTALFVVVPLLGLRLWRHPKSRAVLGGLALGFAPLLLLPLWSGVDTPFSWGDLRTVDGVLTHLLRREYGTFQLASGEHTGSGLSAFLAAFVQFEWHQVFALIAVGALVGVTQVRSKWLVAAVLGFASALFIFGSLANLSLDEPLLREVVARFFLLPHLLLCAACGLAPLPGRRGLVVAAGLLVVGVTMRPHHDATSVRSYGLSLLEQPSNALVLTQGDLIGNSMRALQACEHVRPELRVIDEQLLTYPWYVARLRRAFPDVVFPEGTRWHPTEGGAFRLQQFLDANANRPLVVCGGFKAGDVHSYRAVPWGLCERLIPAGAAFDEETWFRESEAALPSLSTTDVTAPKGSWEEVVRRDVWNARAQRGLHALNVAIARADDQTWLSRAYTVLKDCMDHDEGVAPSTFKNFGIAAGRLGRTDEMKVAFKRYLASAPRSDPEVPAIRALAQ